MSVFSTIEIIAQGLKPNRKCPVPCTAHIMDIQNAIINDLLCYVSSAKSSLSHETLITSACAFYTPEVIKEAKAIACDIAKERNVNRKKTANQPQPAIQDLEDI